MSRAAALLDTAAARGAHRSVAVTIGGETAWIRLRSPGAGSSLLLDVAAHTIAATIQQVEHDAPANADAVAAEAHEATLRALREVQSRKLEDTIDRYLVETVCGVADPLGDGSSPDPETDTAWDPYEVTDKPRKATAGRPYVRSLPLALRRTVYVAVLQWIRGDGAEVASTAATFRRPE